jgi:transposase-like protein
MSHDRVKPTDFNGTITTVSPATATQVVPRPKRRQFTARYKLRILQEADACAASGQIGALLRREGLYYSNLRTWRRQRDQGQLSGLSPKKRGPKEDPVARENARLKREVEKLKAKLERAETIIDVQKKLSQILGLSLPEDAEK